MLPLTSDSYLERKESGESKVLEHDGWNKQEYHRRSVTDKQRILDEQS